MSKVISSLFKKSKNKRTGAFVIYKNGELVASPLILNWIKMPSIISENDIIELFKRDLLIINTEFDIDYITKLIELKSKYIGFLYSIDEIINIYPEEYDVLSILNNINNSLIKNSLPFKSVVFTKSANNFIKNFFINKNINVLSGITLSSILSLKSSMFFENSRTPRGFIRLNFFPFEICQVKLINQTRVAPEITAYLKDLSLNGMAFKLKDSKELSYFRLRDIVNIKFLNSFNNNEIYLSIVTRIGDDNIIGINYNINDRNMIEQHFARELSRMMYKWLKEVIINYGIIEIEKELKVV